jgi:hypothetical protein
MSSAGHFDLYEQATAHGTDEMAMRPGYGVSAWKEVERLLRSDARG